MNREEIYSSLFNLVTTAPGLVTMDRKLRHWDDVQPTEMPALFQAQGSQIAIPMTRQPTRWMLTATLWIYVRTEGVSSPGIVLNPIVDFVANVLDEAFPGQPQTLGGLVEYARIEGTIETFEGTLGNLEVCRIPVAMLTA